METTAAQDVQAAQATVGEWFRAYRGQHDLQDADVTADMARQAVEQIAARAVVTGGRSKYAALKAWQARCSEAVDVLQASEDMAAHTVETGETMADVVDALRDAGVAATVVQYGSGIIGIYSGDDAQACSDATDGILSAAATVACHVCCSAHFTGDAGEGTAALERRPFDGFDRVTVAIDTNGDAATVRRYLEAVDATNVVDAVGVYDGQALPSIVADVERHALELLHNGLRSDLKGFGCFAILA